MLANLFVSLFTFPGIIVHELGHKFFCDWAKVKVLKVCYFRFGNPAGYVIHEAADKFLQSLLISVGPLLLGTIFSVALFLLSDQHVGTIKGVFFAWLGFAIAANAFPSAGDARALWGEAGRHSWRNPLALVGFPIALLIWIVSKLNIFYFNYVFALFLFWLVAVYLK